MKRRDFLIRGALVTGGLAVGGVGLPWARSILQKKKPKILVVGAGLSGLSIAYELNARNFDVVIVEATNRVGGRVLTERGSFLDNQYTEHGATMILDNHHRVLNYARKFGLPIGSFPSRDPHVAYYFRGKRYIDSEKEKTFFPSEWRLSQDEDEHGLSWIQTEYFRKGFSELGDPRKEGWHLRKETQSLDSLSFAEYLTGKQASETAIAIEMAVEGSGGWKNSAALWEAQAYLDQSASQTVHISGGNDQLPMAFYRSLAGLVHFGTEVTAVERGAATMATLKSGSKSQKMEVDAVVFTVSPKILAKINFQGSLPVAKQDSFRKVAMAPVTKVTLVMKKRFWRPLNTLFAAYSDSFIERVWDLSVAQAGQAGLLVAYAQEDNALRLEKMSVGVVPATLAQMEVIMPGARAHFHSGHEFSWHAQDWVGGAWVSYGKNQLPVMKELGRQEKNLFFAGDHTSLRNAWMEGALESAERVVMEIQKHFS